MNISGIRPYDGFYQYNSIKLNELRSQQIAASNQDTREQATSEEDVRAAEAQRQQEYDAFAANQSFDAYDYAQLYRADESYSLKGIDSDINNLDMEKAISGLEKDQVLQQYQYFVGDGAFVSAKPKDASEAVWRSGENFIL